MNNPATALITGIYTVLNGSMTISGVTYPVYTNREMGQTNRAYVLISTYLDREEGTKDSFGYTGTIAVENVDEAKTINAAMTSARALSNKSRSLLTATKGGAFSVTGYTITYFRLTGSTETREEMKDGRTIQRVIDIYEFLMF